jgi:glycosyltransferase involved in cell wall biosynthesis
VKIALVNQPFGPISLNPLRTSSIGIWIYEVARRLAHSCDVTVYAKRAPEQGRQESAEGVSYRRVTAEVDEPMRKLLSVFARFYSPKRPAFASKLYYREYISKIAGDLAELQPDIVHLHNFSQFVPLVRNVLPRTKIVLHMHCEWLNQLNNAEIQRRLGNTDMILGCSEYIVQNICKAFPNLAGRCQTLFNGVDTDYFKLDRVEIQGNDAVRRLLFVGRVSPEKGVHVLLEALSEISKTHPHVGLDIVGPMWSAPREFICDLSDDRKVRRLTRFYDSLGYIARLRERLELSSPQQVRLLGPLPHEKLLGRYEEASILVFPSVWEEPFGIPIIEAMACGVPVVATRGGGIPEIVRDGDTGLLVERDDADALACAILKLLGNDPLRASMGKAGRTRAVDSFSWNRVADTLLEYYHSLLAK